jgi:hypothetical protein
MKKSLLTTILGLALVAPLASAAPIQSTNIYVDASSVATATGDWNGDSVIDSSDLITDVFGYFITNGFSPTSTYIDDNGVAGINTGDSVSDAASGINIGSLNPLGGTPGGFGTDWGLNLNWNLSGTAIVAPDLVTGTTNYLGDFTSGTISFDITDSFGGAVVQSNALVLSIVGSGGFPVFNAINAEIYASVTSSISGFFFTNDGFDFNTLLNIPIAIDMLGTGNVSGLDNAPTLVGNNGLYDVYERTTQIDSFDIRVVPEPASLAIMGLGLLGFAASRKRKTNK